MVLGAVLIWKSTGSIGNDAVCSDELTEGSNLTILDFVIHINMVIEIPQACIEVDLCENQSKCN